MDEMATKPRNRLVMPVRRHQGVIAVTACVVRGGVIAKTIGDRFDPRRSATPPRAFEPAFHRRANGDDVIAVDLEALDARGDGLLRQRPTGGLLLDRNRYRPPIVVDHENHRRPPYAREIERLVYVAF